MKKNPFKFGSIVADPYFTNRQNEIKKVHSIVNSDNHLIITSPRRYGKSSLVLKAIDNLNRPVISMDLQIITSQHDLAAQLLKRIYSTYPFEKIRQYVMNFRIIPTININPVTNNVEVSFQPDSGKNVAIFEDVLNLLEKLSKKNKKLIVIFDEFQDIKRIDSTLIYQFRSIMQHHQNVNYIFLGSQESMIKDIFEKKKSPFYHFGYVMSLNKIPEIDFKNFLIERFSGMIGEPEKLAGKILAFTKCHPYYTQQLAYSVWEKCMDNDSCDKIIEMAIEELIHMHDLDYEKIWYRFNITDKKLLIGMSGSSLPPLSDEFTRKYDLGASSTAFSSLKRLMNAGYIIKVNSNYEIDDPFFTLWIKKKRGL